MRLLKIAVIAVCLSGSAAASAQKPGVLTPKALPTCEDAFQNLWNLKRQYAGRDQFATAVAQLLTLQSEPACGAKYLGSVPGNALALFQPARKSLFEALENYSPQQQSMSSLSSAASVMPVSKVSGVSSIAEEFSGVSVNSGTSALTFQFAPATTLSTLEEQSVIVPCAPAIGLTEHCVSGVWKELAERLTFSLTANTSTAAQSIKGTATGSSSGTSVLANLTNAGSTEPSFGGFGVKGVILSLGSKPGKGSTPASTYKVLSQDAAHLGQMLDNTCAEFGSWVKNAAVTIVAQSDETSFLSALQAQYAPLGVALSGCLKTDPSLEMAVQNFLASYLIVATGTQTDLESTPTLQFGGEYDVNEPTNQPSYSSFKVNFAWNVMKGAEARQAGKKSNKAGSGEETAEKAIGGSNANPAGEVVSPVAKASLGARQMATTAAQDALALDKAAPSMVVSAGTTTTSSASQGVQKKAAKTGAANNTPPISLSASLSWDVYDNGPPSGVPGTERLRDMQAGAEIDWVVPSSKIPKLGRLIGDSTAAGSYYYQDQTSPGIVTGPPSSITIAGLPSTAKTVYATKGPINLGQVRWGLGTGSNVNFPICFTYSNRSELITHPIKGFQFGLSYNLSALFAHGSNTVGNTPKAVGGN